MASNLFITGRIRSGKSTLLKNEIDKISQFTGGYFIQRLFIRGESCAFRMADISEEIYIPDRNVDSIEDYDDLIAVQGEKKFYLSTFEDKGICLISKGLSEKKIILMDEVGRIETNVSSFMQAVYHALDSDVPVIGVIKKEKNPFLDRVRARADVQILDMDLCEHDRVRAEVKSFIMQYAKISI